MELSKFDPDMLSGTSVLPTLQTLAHQGSFRIRMDFHKMIGISLWLGISEQIRKSNFIGNVNT